jgi:ankyrin repeat protein
VDHASDDGFTALHVAAQHGHTAVIQALVGPRM